LEYASQKGPQTAVKAYSARCSDSPETHFYGETLLIEAKSVIKNGTSYGKGTVLSKGEGGGDLYLGVETLAGGHRVSTPSGARLSNTHHPLESKGGQRLSLRE